MNNLFTKTLLCGVLASSFLLINCQKAPNRAVKAQINPTAKPQAAKVGVCTADIASDYDLLKKSDKKIQDKLKALKDVADGKVAPSDVEELHALAKELNGLAKKVMAAIAVLKVDACKIHEDNDAKKAEKDLADSSRIKQVRSNAGKAIKAKTKVDNEITNEDAVAASEILTVGQELKLSDELALIMSDDANSKGAAVISGGKIEKGAVATALLANKDVTACSILISKKEEVKPGSAIKIVTLEGVKLVEKRNVMNVVISVVVRAEGNAAMSFSCNLADKKEGEAEKEIRKALGALVSEVVKAQPIPPVVASGDGSTASGDGSVASGDGTVASGDSSAASGDATATSAAKKKAAAAGLAILDKALLR